MPGYVGTLLDIEDAEKFRDYVRAVAPTLAKYGGRIALRAGRSPTSSRGTSMSRPIPVSSSSSSNRSTPPGAGTSPTSTGP